MHKQTEEILFLQEKKRDLALNKKSCEFSKFKVSSTKYKILLTLPAPGYLGRSEPPGQVGLNQGLRFWEHVRKTQTVQLNGLWMSDAVV